jgi:hypothetical protein
MEDAKKECLPGVSRGHSWGDVVRTIVRTCKCMSLYGVVCDQYSVLRTWYWQSLPLLAGTVTSVTSASQTSMTTGYDDRPMLVLPAKAIVIRITRKPQQYPTARVVCVLNVGTQTHHFTHASMCVQSIRTANK